MSPGLNWIRHRQRRFARALLPLFGLVWLQLAAMPCIGAHQAAVEVAAEASIVDHASDQHAIGHDHCPYCPAAGGAEAVEHCDDVGQCAYPHEPGVDARFASLAALPAIVAPPLPGLLEVPCSLVAVREDRLDPARRLPLSVRYCRFIE